MWHALVPGRLRLQKLFSSFPDGWPGVGLVLLRLAVALNTAVQGVGALAVSTEPAFTLWIVALPAILAGVALLIGFFTPVAGAATTLAYGVMGASLLLHSGAVMRDSAFTALDLAAISIALVLLGPGAFSLDARIFGRREIIIPQERRPPC